MIKSGGSFLFKGIRYVIGAVLAIKGKYYMASASHIFYGSGIGSRILVDGVGGTVKMFLQDFDVALVELDLGCDVEITVLGSASVMDDALLFNNHHSIPCKVIRAGASLLYLQFPCSDMPQPGDSGSPIWQNGKMIGLLSSVMFGNCTGTAVSADVFQALEMH